MTRTNAPRAVRSDAWNNRQKLLEAALDAFSVQGVDAPLDRIARQAGVGIGTLYRHFPTRESLVMAAYQHDVEQLCAAADDLARHLPAEAALRAWMERFSAYLVTKRGMMQVIQAVVAQPGSFYASVNVRARMLNALETLLRLGTEAGVFRRDMEAEVVLLALTGVWNASAGPQGPRRAAQLIELLLDGLKTQPAEGWVSRSG